MPPKPPKRPSAIEEAVVALVALQSKPPAPAPENKDSALMLMVQQLQQSNAAMVEALGDLKKRVAANSGTAVQVMNRIER